MAAELSVRVRFAILLNAGMNLSLVLTESSGTTGEEGFDIEPTSRSAIQLAI
jgi:hypothetical protein